MPFPPFPDPDAVQELIRQARAERSIASREALAHTARFVAGGLRRLARGVRSRFDERRRRAIEAEAFRYPVPRH